MYVCILIYLYLTSYILHLQGKIEIIPAQPLQANGK